MLPTISYLVNIIYIYIYMYCCFSNVRTICVGVSPRDRVTDPFGGWGSLLQQFFFEAMSSKRLENIQDRFEKICCSLLLYFFRESHININPHVVCFSSGCVSVLMQMTCLTALYPCMARSGAFAQEHLENLAQGPVDRS